MIRFRGRIWSTVDICWILLILVFNMLEILEYEMGRGNWQHKKSITQEGRGDVSHLYV